MKRILFVGCFLLAFCSTRTGWAQSTTGGRSGGSSASTGAGYTSPGRRPAASKPASMTIADEGASRDYMYVPPTGSSGQKNRSASPDGSGAATGGATGRSSGSRVKTPVPQQSPGKP